MSSVIQHIPKNRFRFDYGIAVAMVVALIVRPLLYTIVTPMLFRGDGSAGRGYWWLLYSWILFWEWMPFGVLWLALRRSGRQWQEVGVDWSYFVHHRTVFFIAITSFIAIAFTAPHFLYHGSVPQMSQTFSFLPVTGFERVFFLIAAVSGGICEEICYRGLPLRMFADSTIQAWLVLPVAMLAFVFIHGRFGASHLQSYLICGLLYGGVFILLGRRHLEWLIVAHALYDSLFVFAP